ncbi:hypothetical protein GIB67_007748 [Kingdonia uniflora]|uniref:Protein NEDD1 n=1 Tax=Kingdonia uniflora TaxID=39325 RepID=A0A7J7N1W4_9MAGN|nr:hypothetical protein GIB67_007748 [Kingdonia uniflora]
MACSFHQAVTSLCWQRSKPIIVNETNCNAETALLGGAGEESILMPDPLPSMTSTTPSLTSSTVTSSRIFGRSGLPFDVTPYSTSSSGSISSLYPSSAEETPHGNRLWPSETLSRLQAPHTISFKDDMEVFSPLVDVRPITPSLEKGLDDLEDGRKYNSSVDKKPTDLIFPSSIRRFPFTDEPINKIFEYNPTSTSRQDDTRSSLSLHSTPPASSKSEESFSAAPSEAWGGETPSDKFDHLRKPITFPSNFPNNVETSFGLAEHVHLKGTIGQANFESQLPGSPAVSLPRRFTTYADRISTSSSVSDGSSFASGSPKAKKTGAETREELLNSLLSRPDMSASTGTGSLPAGKTSSQPQRSPLQAVPQQQGTDSFKLQLFQRALEETLASVQKSIHEDMRNLHIELIRQFHMQEVEMSNKLNSVLKKQDELTKEVQTLRKENQQLRQLL